MNLVDIALLLLLAAALFFALRRVWKTRKTGGCSCGKMRNSECGIRNCCGGCSGCNACARKS